jgi:hypothetical protein
MCVTNQPDGEAGCPNLFLKALGPEVDYRVCAAAAHKGDVVGGCGPDGSETRATGQLNRIRSDVSCRPVNDHCLASFELGLIKQRLPCRHGNDRNRGSFNVGQRGWLPRDHRRGSDSILGIGPGKPGIRSTISRIPHTQVRNPWPTATISPDRSEPGVRGSGCGKTLLPALIQPSQGPTPAASTLTRTSLGPGMGRGTRSNLMTSGGPNSCTRQAIIDE